MRQRNSMFVLLAGAWLLLSGVLLAQKPRIISEEWRPDTTTGRELLAPFDGLGDLHSWDSGFDEAGRRQSTVLPGGRRRLEYVLSNLGADAADGLEGFGKLGFRERWLMCHLQRQFPDLERVDVVTT